MMKISAAVAAVMIISACNFPEVRTLQHYSALVTNLVCIYIAVRLQKSSRKKRASSNASEEGFYEDMDEVKEEYYEAEQQMLKAKEEAELRHQEEERRRQAYVPREVTIRQLFRLQNVCYKILSRVYNVL